MTTNDYANIALSMATKPFPEWTPEVRKLVVEDGMKYVLNNMGLVFRGWKRLDDGRSVWDGTISLAEDPNMRPRNYLSRANAEPLSDEQIETWKNTIVLQDVDVGTFKKGVTEKFSISKMPGDTSAEVYLGDGSNILIGYITVTTDSRSPWIIPSEDKRERFFTFSYYSKAKPNAFQDLVQGWHRNVTPKGVTKSWIFTRPDNHRDVLVDRGILSHSLINAILVEQFGITPIIVSSSSMTMLDVVKCMKSSWHQGERMCETADGQMVELEKEVNDQTIKVIVGGSEVGSVRFEKSNTGGFFAKVDFMQDVELPSNERHIVNTIHSLLGCDSGFRKEETIKEDMSAEVGTFTPQMPKKDNQSFKGKRGKKFGKRHNDVDNSIGAMTNELDKIKA